ncbi:oxidoreductase [Yersinia canariae]|uniref:Oxidoreductase n=1 Tax=Yersinia canariae TaxID=2607663 RepID=A0A857F278_9GAMM|nr:oxidoreductase [Yersinia canariae]QHB33082.1 oxidoreductase [Yersinia canariae]
MDHSAKTLLITGVSSGFGRALAEEALQQGFRVVGTVRNQQDKIDFEALNSDSAFARILDVTHDGEPQRVVASIEREIGHIDVLVNNAGYGLEGILEETSLDQVRRQFDVNVFGAVAMIQATLPYMRQRGRGHILNITSMGGMITLPGLGIYHGSKFALEGISESLAKEVRDLGIYVTAIEPGAFRTDWAGRSMVRAERSIRDYDAVFEPLRQRRQEVSGKQLGNPIKAAQVMLTLIDSDNPPMHLLLGSDAVRLVKEKMALLQREFSEWETLSLSTDFQ